MQDPLLGRQLGSYRLVQVLGQGSFAQVYRGQHIHLGASAAIKVLHAQLGEQEKQSFHKEALLLVKLKHAHIIRLLDYGILSGQPFLITDLAEKGSLNKMHPRGTRVPLPQIVEYVTQIAEGLDFAHTLNIIHRDIKPENILVSDTNELVLADFGIAKLLGATGSYLTGSMAGTLPYMSPELFDGRPVPASDQYALGVMVYEWLAGRFPFEGTAGELIKHHLQDAPPPLRFFNPMVSPEVELVVLTTLKKDPAQRFRTVQAFANALRQAAGMGLQAGRGDSAVLPAIDLPPGSPGFYPNSPQPPRQPQPNNPPMSPRVANPVPIPTPNNPVPGPAYPLPSSPSRPPLPSDPAGSSGAPIAPSPQVAPAPSDPGVRMGQPVSTDPSRVLSPTDTGEWQKLLPPQQSLSFTELPSLPQAELTDFWWPTFIVSPEQRRKINQGTVLSEMLSSPGPLASFPSLSIALPVSNTVSPPSSGRLDNIQRISEGTRSSLPPVSKPLPTFGSQLGSGQSSIGRVAQPVQGQGQRPIQAQPGQPVGRTAPPAQPGGNQPGVGKVQPGTPVPAGGSTAAGFAVLTLIIGFFCTIGGGNAHSYGTVGASWIFILVCFICSIIGLNQVKQNNTLKGWLIFFLVACIFMAFINIAVDSSIATYCSYNICS